MKPMKVIGGCFALETPRSEVASKAAFLEGGPLWVVNGRSGIRLVAEAVCARTIWMPSYLCGVMVTGLGRLKSRVRYYGVDERLELVSLDWLRQVERNDLVVVIDYFGFPCSRDLKSGIRKAGGWNLEDACQALLTKGVGENSDFTVFGPRKFLGVPDGALIRCGTKVKMQWPSLQDAPSRWWNKSLASTVLRRDFDLQGGDRNWFKYFQEADAEAPCGAFSASTLSRNLLSMGIDYDAVSRQRRANYRFLLEQLDSFALMRDLPAGVVPLGFPVRLDNRDAVRQQLFKQNIYPPVHWDLRRIVPGTFEASHLLSRQIMTLPCDQRYSLDDMDRMVRAFKKARPDTV